MSTAAQLAEAYIEVLGASQPEVRNANQYVEVLVQQVVPAARTAEIYVEVLAVRPPDPVFIGWGVAL